MIQTTSVVNVNGGLIIPNNGGLNFPTLNMGFSIVEMEALHITDGGTIHDTIPAQRGLNISEIRHQSRNW